MTLVICIIFLCAVALIVLPLNSCYDVEVTTPIAAQVALQVTFPHDGTISTSVPTTEASSIVSLDFKFGMVNNVK